MASNEATRIDPRTGVRETFAFVGDDSQAIAAMTHLPSDSPRAGIVVCSSILSDNLRNYRTEVVLSRLLASRGVAVQRFHYRGTGNSDGDAHEMDLESMLEDAHTAANQLMTFGEIDNVGFMGTRFGALIAAAASSSHPGQPLVLLEPVVESELYFGDSFQAQLLARVTRDGLSRMSREELLENLAAKGEVDIVGFTLTSKLYESTKDLALDALLPMDPRPVLLAQLGGNELRPEFQDLLDALPPGEGKRHVIMPEGESWWFIEEGGAGAEQRRKPEEAATAIATWVVEGALG